MSFPLVEIGDICDVVNGSTPSRTKLEYWGGNINWFTPKDLSKIKGKYVYEAPEKISEIGYKSCSTTLIPKNSLLFTSRAPIGHIAINREEVCTNQGFKNLVPKDGVDVEFLYYAIKKYTPELQDLGNGATFKEISKSTISAFKIPLPPLSTQKKIAAILDAADAHRQKTRQLLAKYDALAQSIFLEMFGDPVTNPKGWEVRRMGEICGVGSSKRVFVNELLEEGIPFYRGTEVGGLATGEKISPKLFISSKHFEELKSHTGVPKVGDLLMPSICPDSRIWKVNTNLPFYFKDGRVLWVKVNLGVFSSTYLLFLLKELFRTNYHEIASGTTFAELKIIALKGLKVLVPGLGRQQEFETKINNVEAQKFLLKKEVINSENLFNSLLQKAFKGDLVK